MGAHEEPPVTESLLVKLQVSLAHFGRGGVFRYEQPEQGVALRRNGSRGCALRPRSRSVGEADLSG
jgi:hypothetical protein